MCKKNTEKKGYIFSQEELLPYFEACHRRTITKLGQWSDRLEELVQSGKAIDNKTDSILRDAVKNVTMITESLDSNTYLMLLGGCKGLLLSLVVNKEFNKKNETEILPSGLFMDSITKLPYGLVEISQVKRDE